MRDHTVRHKLRVPQGLCSRADPARPAHEQSLRPPRVCPRQGGRPSVSFGDAGVGAHSAHRAPASLLAGPSSLLPTSDFGKRAQRARTRLSTSKNLGSASRPEPVTACTAGMMRSAPNRRNLSDVSQMS